MTPQQNWKAIAILAVTCIASILLLDRPLARVIDANLQFLNSPLQAFTGGVELLFGFTISKYLAGFVFLVVAAVFVIKDKTFYKRAHLFTFIALSHMLSRLVAGVLKNVFLRTRPYDYLDGTFSDFWTSGGSSFPSGHTAHFFGLFLPFVLLFPKRAPWLLILPIAIGLSRVLVNDHYLSDVLGSVVISLLITIGMAKALNIQSQNESLLQTAQA